MYSFDYRNILLHGFKQDIKDVWGKLKKKAKNNEDCCKNKKWISKKCFLFTVWITSTPMYNNFITTASCAPTSLEGQSYWIQFLLAFKENNLLKSADLCQESYDTLRVLWGCARTYIYRDNTEHICIYIYSWS